MGQILKNAHLGSSPPTETQKNCPLSTNEVVVLGVSAALHQRCDESRGKCKNTNRPLVSSRTGLTSDTSLCAGNIFTFLRNAFVLCLAERQSDVTLICMRTVQRSVDREEKLCSQSSNKRKHLQKGLKYDYFNAASCKLTC